jgi:UDP-N-acetyl-alpha-D-muramoyl-L-alanyl-L-glutamate epimerase
MAAFLPAEKLLKIFGKNLFENETLIPLYKELLGLEGYKPFECVGIPDEVSAAFLLALQQPGWEDTPALQMFLTEMAPTIKNPKQLIQDTLELSDEHSIPPQILAQLQP